MSTATAVSMTILSSEEVVISRKAVFDSCDKRVREIETLWNSTWVDLADAVTTVHDSELWREGGYASFGSWLQSACPCSRSTAYALMGVRKELAEIPEGDLKQMPPGNAIILRDTPKQSRSIKVLEAAKQQPPREFIGTVIQEAPESHLEKKQCHKFRPTTSQSKKWQEAFAMWRVVNEDPHAPVEDVLEGIITDWMEGHQAQYEWKAEKQ